MATKINFLSFKKINNCIIHCCLFFAILVNSIVCFGQTKSNKQTQKQDSDVVAPPIDILHKNELGGNSTNNTKSATIRISASGLPEPAIGIDSLIHYLSDAAVAAATGNGSPAGKFEIRFSIDVEIDGSLSKIHPLNDPGYGVTMLPYLIQKTSPLNPAGKNGTPVVTKNFIIKIPYEIKEE